MTNRYGYSTYLLYLFLTFFCATCIVICVPSLFKVKHCYLRDNGLLTSSPLASIKEFLIHETADKPFSALLAKKLQTEFPFIEHCSASYKVNKSVVCSIHAAQPLLMLNDHLLLANNALVPCSLYEPWITQALPTITLKTTEKITGNTIPDATMLKQIPSALFEKYTMVCKEKNMIHMIDKNQQKFIVVTNKDAVKTVNVFACDTIKNELEHKGAFKKNYWVADTRFKNQIVVHSQQEGVL